MSLPRALAHFTLRRSNDNPIMRVGIVWLRRSGSREAFGLRRIPPLFINGPTATTGNPSHSDFCLFSFANRLQSPPAMNEQLMAKCGCSHCETHLEFPIEGAGTTINCPHCGEPTELSLEAPIRSAASDKPSAVELLAGFTGTVPRTRVSLFYQIGLMLVTVMMLLL